MDNQHWWTTPLEDENGELVMVTGRGDISTFRNHPRFHIRITVGWQYGPSGMPSEADAKMMETATDEFHKILTKDPVAVLTGIYTGAGRRDWVFYTLSTNIFNNKLNEAFRSLPLLPLEISAENDPEWEEYDEMCSLSRQD